MNRKVPRQILPGSKYCLKPFSCPYTSKPTPGMGSLSLFMATPCYHQPSPGPFTLFLLPSGLPRRFAVAIQWRPTTAFALASGDALQNDDRLVDCFTLLAE